MKTGEEAGILAEDAVPVDANMPHVSGEAGPSAASAAASAQDAADHSPSPEDPDHGASDPTYKDPADKDPADQDAADRDSADPDDIDANCGSRAAEGHEVDRGEADRDEAGGDEVGDEEPGGDEPGDDESGDAGKPRRQAGAPVWTTVMALLVVALIIGVVTAAGYHSRVSNYNAQASSRQAAIAVATTAVTDLTTADYKDPTQYVDKLKPLAVGNFLSLFTNSASGFQDVLVQGKVQTTGRVAYVGVQRMGTGTAQLTVLAYVTVKNSQTPKGSQRVYRLAVSMIQSGSQWLVSNVEFVQ